MPYLLVTIHVVLLEYNGRCNQVANLVIVGKVERLTKMVLVSFILVISLCSMDQASGQYSRSVSLSHTAALSLFSCP